MSGRSKAGFRFCAITVGDIPALEGERQAGEGQVRGDVVVGVVLFRAGGLLVDRRRVELRAVEGLRVVDERRPLRRASVELPDGVGLTGSGRA